ncbi:MAG: DsbA family oxidoreductase [Opitutaceae bacterium]|nr:DsbA family oxidoreductase [Cytophagales bacterium]
METLKLNPVISVDVVSDVACPWCYIGKKHLEAAIKQLQNEFEFKVEFKPFQLDPTIPKDGIDSKTYFLNKFGSEDRLEQIFNRVESTGASLGIRFNFNKIVKAINTLPLHAILKMAAKENIQQQVADKLFEAYMVEPQNLSDENVLILLMKDFGWDADKTLAVIHDKDLIKSIKEEIIGYQQMQITGVPYFIINNKYGVSGAQPSEMFVNAFRSLKPEDFPVNEDLSCSIDGNNC